VAPPSLSALVEAAGWGALVGASLVAGALVAAGLRLPARVAALATTFGGGLLLAALAFELVPDADERAGPWVTSVGLAVGTVGVSGRRRVAHAGRGDEVGAAQPIVAAGRSRRFAVGLLSGTALVVAGATILGATALSDVGEDVVGFLQGLAGGAVFAVVLVSIVPHAFAEVSRWVAAAAAGGFLLGYLL
jgi:ABC-type Fe3+-siderophore transport system permease subunit